MNKVKPYPETHQQGCIEVSNSFSMLGLTEKPDGSAFGMDKDFGVQIAGDGRVWVCINGIAFIRFTPKYKQRRY